MLSLSLTVSACISSDSCNGVACSMVMCFFVCVWLCLLLVVDVFLGGGSLDFCFVSCCWCSGVCLVIVCYGEVSGLAFSLCLCRCFLVVGFSCTVTFPGAAWFDRMSVHSEAPRE